MCLQCFKFALKDGKGFTRSELSVFKILSTVVIKLIRVCSVQLKWRIETFIGGGGGGKEGSLGPSPRSTTKLKWDGIVSLSQ